MKKLFSFRDFDTHYILTFFGIQINIRHKVNFDYKPASEYGITTEKRTPQLIVSLSSFPARIEKVHLTINTLLRQNLKPDRVVLWLTESQFPNGLPKSLTRLLDLGLEIKYCEDLRSYKKLVPSLREFPEDIIVTADDDMYYKEDWLEGLYQAYLDNPKNIYTRRGCRARIVDGKIDIIKPRDYNFEYNFPTDYNNLLMGGSGTLYPPHSLHNDIFNTDLIKTLIPTHDDIYFWVMGILKGTKIGVVGGFDYSFYYTEAASENGLCLKNTSAGSGMSSEEALDKISAKYPEIIEKLRKED